ncbi:MAG: CGNR zinc finger domain-containing protein [Jatrophihabitantaceae bacterium]
MELVRAFVNSLDLEHGIDEFATEESLGRWLSSCGLIDVECPVAPSERDLAVRVREALRQLSEGSLRDPRALNDAARSADTTLEFGLDATPTLRSDKAGVTGAVGTILVITATAAMNGTWRRMKVCSAEDCRWMFYDHSKNRSGTWCQMAECGNRAKARAFRSRSSAHAASVSGTARSRARQTV